MIEPPLPPSRSWTPAYILAFWVFAALLGLGSFHLARSVTTCWQVTALPGLPPAHCTEEELQAYEPPSVERERIVPTARPFEEPPAPEEIEYPTWDGSTRINILFVGLRGEGEDGCGFCTDTLILLTVDPVEKTAGMLSIPRDMWVNIPGFGYSRINTAWTLGRNARLPGGGPELAMQTVSHFIGVPVDYYVQVDFDTFIEVVDLLGGVEIYNDETLFLDPVAHGREYPKVKLTCCGTRHLNGMEALAYARCRHLEQGCTNGDIGRAGRQQKVIFAIRDKVLDPRNFPLLMAQAPELYRTFSTGIHTNLSLDDAVRLAALVREIPREEIKQGVIDNSMVIFDSVTLGGQKASILRPIPEKVRLLRDSVFGYSEPVGPLAADDPASWMLLDQARVRVLNGTSRPGLELDTRSYLLSTGVTVTEMGKSKALSRTTITLYAPKLYALRFLLDLFEITRSPQILIKPDPEQTVDIEIHLGADWVNKLPPPEDYTEPLAPRRGP